MEKVVKILEQYVQWIALALGVIWLSYQVYGYVVQEPLTVIVGTPPVKANSGNVDKVIKDSDATKLDKAMANTEVKPPALVNVLEIVTRSLSEADANPVVMNTLASGSEHQSLKLDGAVGPVGPIVTRIPHLPPATPDKYTTRWTVIMVPASPQPPAPAPAAPGIAPVPAQPVMVRQDVAYFSGLFTVNQSELSKEFDECFALQGVPPNLLLAEFVRVELLREEQKPDGTWNAFVVIPTLPIHEIMPYPPEQKPPLAPAALTPALFAYKQWFEANQEIIIHPTFYQTAEGAEPWLAPGDAPPAVAAQAGAPPVAERPFDPSRDIPKTPDEIRAKQAYEAAIRARRLENRHGPLTPGARPGTSGVPGAFTPPPNGVPPVLPGGRPEAPVYPPANSGGPPAFINPNAGGQVNWNNAGANIQIMVHDTSIQEGKTYRYAVRYKLFNPMFNHPESAKEWIAAKFDVDSPTPLDSNSLQKPAPAAQLTPDQLKADAEKLWTPVIKVEPLSHIFVTKIAPFSSQADFMVYTWKDGRWKETAIKKLMPGDPVTVGKTPTPWTLVDVRKDAHSNEAYVILMDDHGILIRRDEADDAQNVEWQKLKGEAAGGAAAAAH